MRGCIARIEFNSTLILSFRGPKIEVINNGGPGQRCVGFRQPTIHFNRLERQLFRSASAFIGVDKSPKSQERKAVGQAGVSGNIGRIFCNCLLEVLDSVLQPFPAAPVPVIAPFEICLVGLRIDDLYLLEVCLLLRCQFDLNLPCDGLGYL